MEKLTSHNANDFARLQNICDILRSYGPCVELLRQCRQFVTVQYRQAQIHQFLVCCGRIELPNRTDGDAIVARRFRNPGGFVEMALKKGCTK